MGYNKIVEFHSPGQSLLFLVILIGGIIAVIGITLAFSTNNFLSSEYGYQSAEVAEATATAGAEDALIKLDRDVAFSSGGYSLTVGSTTASITVTQNTPSTNYISVLSQATVLGSTRKVNVVLLENASTSALTVTSWQEIQ
jgi:hypothetical protein